MRKAPTSIKAHMKNSDLKQNVNTLSKINQMRRGCDRSFLKEFSDEEIHCICEAGYNILDEKILMNKNNKFKLKKRQFQEQNRKIRKF